MRRYSIKIGLDTQILAYLVDGTFPSLNKFISQISVSPYVDLICSRFVTFEFIGIRKHEHYLRNIHYTSNFHGGIMNFSSALKYKNGWNAPELRYELTYPDIKAKVENDLKRINDDFGIEYADLVIHDDLWKPLNDLILSSKLSKEDSLVLLSTIWHERQSGEDHLVFLTNDKDFYNSCYGESKMESVDDVFLNHDLVIPMGHKIKALTLSTGGREMDLTNEYSDIEIADFIRLFILDNLRLKYKDDYVGKVVPCSEPMRGKLLCFKLHNTELVTENIYLTSFSIEEGPITHDVKFTDFHNVNTGKIENFPYAPDGRENSDIISVMLKNSNGEFLQRDDYTRFSNPGNLIFIHPDIDV